MLCHHHWPTHSLILFLHLLILFVNNNYRPTAQFSLPVNSHPHSAPFSAAPVSPKRIQRSFLCLLFLHLWKGNSCLLLDVACILKTLTLTWKRSVSPTHSWDSDFTQLLTSENLFWCGRVDHGHRIAPRAVPAVCAGYVFSITSLLKASLDASSVAAWCTHGALHLHSFTISNTLPWPPSNSALLNQARPSITPQPQPGTLGTLTTP